MKIEHNIHDVVKSFKDLNGVMKRACAMTLNRTANAVKSESARHMKQLRYTDAKWTIPQIRKHISVVSKASVTKDIDKQEVIIRFSSRSLPLLLFSPKNETIQTKRGPRYGVSVKVWGTRFLTGGYHVKGSKKDWKQGSPKGIGTFGDNSRIFIRIKGKVKMFKLLNPGGIMQLRDGEAKLYAFGYRYAADIFDKEWQRAVDNLFYRKSKVKLK